MTVTVLTPLEQVYKEARRRIAELEQKLQQAHDVLAEVKMGEPVNLDEALEYFAGDEFDVEFRPVSP